MQNKRTENTGLVKQSRSRREGRKGHKQPLAFLPLLEARRGRKGIKGGRARSVAGAERPKSEARNEVKIHSNGGLRFSEAEAINQMVKPPITALAVFEIWMAKNCGRSFRSVREHHAFARGYATAWAHFTNPKAGERVFNWLDPRKRRSRASGESNTSPNLN